MVKDMKPITVYGHWGGPNPYKVAILLEELSIPYEWKVIEFSDVKSEAYTTINPNGRLPAIIDPNTDVQIWESGAIILYLIDQYDKNYKLSFSELSEKYQCQQWLMFQMSGQGPYFGQATWFARFHPEKIQSATDRYVNEIVRVTSVLNTALKGKEWLVGEKCTYADLAFVTWASVGKGLLKQLGKEDVYDQYPNYTKWMSNLEARRCVKSIGAKIAHERAAHGLP